MPENQQRLWLITVLSLAITGCNFFAKQTPVAELTFSFPENWQSTSSAEQISLGWLAQFNDPALDQHVRTALQRNFDLQANAEQLNAAIATAKATNANLYPDIDVGVQRNRSKRFAIDEQGLVTTQYSTRYQGDLNLNWEADLWGKLSDRSRASFLDSQNRASLYQAARLSLAANVAQTWFNIIEATNQVALSQHQLESLNEALDIVETGYQAGLNSAVDVFSARSDYENQKALVAQDKQSLQQIKRSLNVLLGDYPSTGLDVSDAKLPDKYIATPAGLPSELLLRRPDILAARLNWLAQDYRRLAARKDRYPSFTLTGNLGESSNNLNDLLDSDDVFWSLLAGITQPVFNAGRLRALEENADAQTRQALAEYSSTILTAFAEVENALTAEQYLLTRYENTKNAAKLAESAYQLALEQYQTGLVDYVTVLTTQRQFFNADSNQISLYNDLIQNRITLHLALGGDFFTVDETINEL